MKKINVTKISEMVKSGMIETPMDGNHGESHPKSSDFTDDGIPFIMASDIVNGEINFQQCKKIRESQARSLRTGFAIEGDVLLTHKATIGRTAIVPKLKYPFLMLTPQVTYYRVKAPAMICNVFLRYAFEHSYFQKSLQQDVSLS